MSLTEEQILNLHHLFTLEPNTDKRKHGCLVAIATMRLLASKSDYNANKMLDKINPYLIIFSLIDLAKKLGLSNNSDNKSLSFQYDNANCRLISNIKMHNKDIMISYLPTDSLPTLKSFIYKEQFKMSNEILNLNAIEIEKLHFFYKQNKSQLELENRELLKQNLLEIFSICAKTFKNTAKTDAEIYEMLNVNVDLKALNYANLLIRPRPRL